MKPHLLTRRRTLGAAFALLLLPTAAGAQFSDSFSFLKAVRDRDVLKAKSFIDKPGSTIINAKDGDTGETALHIVVRRKDTPWMGFLLQNGADPNVRDRDGATPLMLAASSNFPEGVRVMIAGKAQVDLANSGGETALIKAVHARDAAASRLLLEAGADPDRADNRAGLSARDYALRDQRNSPVGKLLAEAPKVKRSSGMGPSL